MLERASMPDSHARLGAVSNLEFLHRLDKLLAEFVKHGVMHKDSVRADASLAGRAELAGDRALDGSIEIGIVEDYMGEEKME